jgi:hypothetical protein
VFVVPVLLFMLHALSLFCVGKGILTKDVMNHFKIKFKFKKKNLIIQIKLHFLNGKFPFLWKFQNKTV